MSALLTMLALDAPTVITRTAVRAAAWYWSAVTAPSGESWWSFVVVKRER